MLELLPLHAVHVDLVAPGETTPPAARERYLAMMAPDEHERMARLVFERDRRRFLLTRALVRTMLSKYAAVAPEDWKFVANVHGRPELIDRPEGVPDLRFNLSHTDGLIACAVTIGREVGVDVEHVGRRVTHDVPARFFAPQEVADLRAVPESDRDRAFYDYWTLKEAYIKARGFGLALPLADFAFRLSPGAPPAISFEPALPDDPATWQFAQDWPTPVHRLGLAVRRTGADLPIRIREVVP
jgi:4'-phosphopantetheinyl transferase